MTPYKKIYDAFLGKLTDDEDWIGWTWEETECDLRNLLEGAIPWFKFPRAPLDRDDNGFTADLDNDIIQILANYMKCEWLNRTILSWENIKPLYAERDFSQANLLDKFTKLLESQEAKTRKLEAKYYRSIRYKSFPYNKLAENE